MQEKVLVSVRARRTKRTEIELIQLRVEEILQNQKYPLETGLPRSGKSQGKTKIFQGQGKVREFCKKSGKISVLVKVSEKSGNFVFRLAQGFVKIMKTFSFRKLSCSRSSGASYVFKCKVFGQWFSL